jgi:hypothetical protein
MSAFRALRSRQTAVCLAGLLSVPAIAFAAEGSFDRTINASSNAKIAVFTGSGYIHISPGSDSQVHVVGHVKSNGGWFSGGSEDRVQQVVANPPIDGSGSDIRIGKRSGDWMRNISIDYEVTVPRGATIDADSGSGDLRIGDITGGLKAGTGSGTIEAQGISGEVALNTGSGDIHAELRDPSTTKAETGSGSIRLDGVKGPLRARTGSGDIEIKGQPTSDWKLDTGSGSVELTTGSAHFTLDASTGSGSIHSDPPITTHGSLERDQVRGEVNGGGASVRVETGSGDIRIH